MKLKDILSVLDEGEAVLIYPKDCWGVTHVQVTPDSAAKALHPSMMEADVEKVTIDFDDDKSGKPLVVYVDY